MTSAFVDHPDKVRYPIGDFGIDPEVTLAKRRQWIRQMDELPQKLAEAVAENNVIVGHQNADGLFGFSHVSRAEPLPSIGHHGLA